MPRTTPPPGAPPRSSWNVHFGVADADAATRRARELGAQVVAERDFYVGLLGWECDASPVLIPGVGRIARIDDPTGAGAYVIKLNRA